MMNAVLIQNDRSLRWDEVPFPVCGDDEVLVEIHYAGVNRADLMQREGNYPPPPGCPPWMGLEVSGIICKMGCTAERESSFRVGDAVCALLGGGGYAEYIAVRWDMLMPLPENCSLCEGAALPEAFCTGYLNLFREGHAKAGDVLLVTGGNSGLASVIIPMAKAFGLTVVATVRSAKTAEAIRPLGADRIVDTTVTALPDVLRELADAGTPVSVAIDCLGGTVMGECLPYLAHGARWIMIASLAGDMTEVNLRTIFVKNIRIIGSTLRSRAPEVKAALMAELVQKVWPMVSDGRIRPTIHAVLPITEAEEAHRILQNGGHSGKVILKVR